MTFGFHLRLQNPDFVLFTNLQEISQILSPIYTNANINTGNPVQLVLSARRIRTNEIFTVDQPATDDRFTLSGHPIPGLKHTDFTIEGLGAITSPAHYDASAKIITVNSESASQDDSFKVTYETVSKLNKNIFADVEILYNDSLPDIAAGPDEFHIAFTAKEARWKYYIIATSNGTNFRIEDKDASPILFSDKNQTNLNQQPDSSDDVAIALAEQYPDMQRTRLVSDGLTPCQQQARKSIQLYLGNDQVAGALPNPSLRNYSTIDVKKNGNLQKQHALFQVVKYITP